VLCHKFSGSETGAEQSIQHAENKSEDRFATAPRSCALNHSIPERHILIGAIRAVRNFEEPGHPDP
jgi:hypothetical protein